MQNQHSNQVISKRVEPKKGHGRGRWRHIVLISVCLATLGILSPWIFLHAIRNEVLQPTSRPISHKPQQQARLTKPIQHISTSGNTQVTERLDALLTDQVNAQQFSGSVLVTQQGKILLAKGYSQANWENSTANTPDTRFYLASITKEFTAMAILMLQERGKLHVGDPLCNYIANCPEPWQPLTIHQLLTHTSGIPELDTSQLSEDSPEAWIASFSTVPLQFTPGGQFQYCSTCYQILAYVVQHTSGVPYSQFIQQNILDPLQMRSSGFDSNVYYSQQAAIGYQTWQVAAPQLGWQLDSQWSFLFGSGLLYSTVNDMYRWDQALYTNTLVSQATLTEAFTPYVNSTLFPGSAYGYGWFIAQSPVQSHRLIWHNGIIDGFRNYIGRYVDDGVTIIILSNLATLDATSLAHSIEKIVFA